MKEKKTILIVDDENAICEALAVIFKSDGYLTITANDGQEAWDIFQKDMPDLVITDFVMPNLNGFELINRIKNETPAMPIIVITGHSSIEIAMKAFEMGADEFLEKPFKKSTIIKKVNDILSKSKVSQTLNQLRKLSDSLLKENKILKEKLERRSESNDGDLAGEEVDKYKAVCREVAHDLKGEFMHIGYSLKEIRGSVNFSREIAEECDMIERSLSYSRLLLQRLLSFLDMGSLQMEPIELAEVIGETEILAKPRLPSNVQLYILVSPNAAKTRISANFDQLMSVFMEFINNASKVLRQRGGVIEIKLEEKDNNALISIKDDGPGIPAELKEKILKEQVPSKYGGLGLGLYLCNRIIHQVGGKLNIETQQDKGTIFTMVLPTFREQKES